jgi:hypothetical protein
MDLTEIGWINHQQPPSYIIQQPYMYNPLPSQLIAQQEMDKDSNTTVLIAHDVVLMTLSPSQDSQEDGFGWLWEMNYGICLGYYLVLYQFQCIERCSGECHRGCSWKLAVEG